MARRSSTSCWVTRMRVGRFCASYSWYSIFQPRLSSAGEGLPCTQAARPSIGRRKPSTRSVSDSLSAARYSRPSAVLSTTASPWRRIWATPCPVGVLISSSSPPAAWRQAMLPVKASLAVRAARRPASEKSSGPSGGLISTCAHAASERRKKQRRLPASLAQPLDGLLQGFVLGTGLERLVPDAPRLVALAEHPQDFAEVRADLGVGAPAVGAAQLARGAFQVALAVKHPAQAVDDEVVLGRELERLLDQLARLGQARIALGERVAERVVGVRVVGLDPDQLAQVRLEQVEALELLRGEREVVEQLGLLGLLAERVAQQREGVRVLVRVAQQLRLGDRCSCTWSSGFSAATRLR